MGRQSFLNGIGDDADQVCMRLPHRITSLLLMLLPLSLASGCQAWRYKPVNRIADKDSIVHYPGDGGVVISSSWSASKTICVAPPAQGVVLQQTKGSGGVKANVADYVEVDVGVNVETLQALGQLYQQSERSLFLQYSLYRLCEAYMNNMLSRATVKQVLQRESDVLAEQSAKLGALHAECESAKNAVKTQIAEIEETKEERSEKKRLEERGKELESDCSRLSSDKTGVDAKKTIIDDRVAATNDDDSYDPGTLYWTGFQLIMDTSLELAGIDAERDKLRAEIQAAQAGEAKAKAEKAKAEADQKAKELDELRKEALEADVAQSKCTQCQEKDKDCVKLCTDAQSDGS